MRIFFAFSVEPLQLKFLNRILGRDDIDHDKLMELIKEKDEYTKDVLRDFSEFQAAAKKYAQKIGNSSNIFLDCLYDRCANDDESFKYVFGERDSLYYYRKSYEVALDSLYDAFKNCEEFSKEGRLMKRAQKIFNGFKQKNTTLKELVDGMNQILADNNRNNEKEDDRTLDQQEEDSWSNLEEHEVFSSDGWHVYRVDEYEDLRNVAADCSSWCVARRDSGRDYFYRTYGPPYYLFSKGRRNPFILMHIESQQFKGLDDRKFNADRPTSYDAIEIGREFLDEIGELHDYSSYDDFSVFNEDNVLPDSPELANAIRNASDAEQLKILDTDNTLADYDYIFGSSMNYDVLAKAIDRLADESQMFHGRNNTNVHGGKELLKSKFYSMSFRNQELVKELGVESAKKLCCKLVDMLDDSSHAILQSLVNTVKNAEIVTELIDRYLDGNPDAFINSSAASYELLEYLDKKGRKDIISKIYNETSDKTTIRAIFRYCSDDPDLLKQRRDFGKLIEDSGDALCMAASSSETLKMLATEVDTGNRKLMDALWMKAGKNPEIAPILFDKMYKNGWAALNNEAGTAMLAFAKSTTDIAVALDCCGNEQEFKEYFLQHEDELKYSSSDSALVRIFRAFARHLDNPELHRLYEKANYDLKLMCDSFRVNIGQTDALNGVKKASQMSLGDVTNLLKNLHNSRISRDKFSWSNPGTPELLNEILKRNHENPVVNTFLYECKDDGFRQSVIEQYSPEPGTMCRVVVESKALQTEGIIRKCLERIRKTNDESRYKNKLLGLPNCPKDMLDQAIEDDFAAYGKIAYSNYEEMEFSKGQLDDEESFLKRYCEHAASTGNLNQIGYLLGKVISDQNRFRKAFGIVFNSNCLDDQQKVGVANSIFGSCGSASGNDLSAVIEWCLSNKVLLDRVLCSPSSTEQQLQEAVEFASDSDIDKALPNIVPAAKKLVEEAELAEEAEPDWTQIVYNDDATEEELERAVEAMDDGYMHSEEVAALLRHKNCTRELAKEALKFADLEEMMNEGIYSILEYTGADILGEVSIDSWDEFKEVVLHARNDGELQKALDYAYNVPAEDDYDPLQDMLDWMALNANSTFGFIDGLIEKHRGDIDPKTVVDSFIEGHEDRLTADEIGEILEKYGKDLNNKSKMSLEGCKGATEEQLVGMAKAFGIPNVGILVDNPAFTAKALILVMDCITSDKAMERLLQSPQATDEAFEKALYIPLGSKSLEVALERASDHGLKRRIEERLKEGKFNLSAQVDMEKDEGKLRELLRRVCKSEQESPGYGSTIAEISNVHALELLAKTRDKLIVGRTISNPKTPEKAVLAALKKFNSSELCSYAIGRTEHDILLLVCCMDKDEEDIRTMARENSSARNFTGEDVMRMLKWNPVCKYEILRLFYFKLDEDQLRYLRKLKDKDVDWLVDAILKKDGREETAARVVRRLLKAERISRRLLEKRL